MKLHVPNTAEIKEFDLVYRPVTLEIYYNQFARDLSQDIIDCFRKYGSLSRSLAIRIIWACAVTQKADFMSFIQFIDSLEYKINDFVTGWGQAFTEWIVSQIKDDLEIINPYENR